MPNIRYTKELLEAAASKSTSFASLMREIGVKPTGGGHRHIQSRCRHFGVDTSHFTGQGWSKGQTQESDDRVRAITKKISYTAEQIFCENSPYSVSKPRARALMVDLGIPYRCECGNEGEWRGNPLTLHVDHINGVNGDNRLENLRFICPNCHQQTETWGKKKIGTGGGI